MGLVRGSGNVCRGLGRPTADLEQARAIVAAKIIRVLDDRKLSTRDAEKLTGITYSEFFRIRGTQLRRITLDRMIGILRQLAKNRLERKLVRHNLAISALPRVVHASRR